MDSIADVRNQVEFCIRKRINSRAKRILEQNPYLCNSVDESNYTLLHICALNNNENIAEYLVSKGCLLDAQDKLGRTSLMISVRYRCREVALVLLLAGANIDSVLNNSEKSVLHLTFSLHQMSAEFLVLLLTKFRKQFTTSDEMAEKLIDLGCHTYQAVCCREFRVVEFMVNQGHSSNSFNPFDKQTAMHYAVFFQDVQLIRFLLEKKADALAQDIKGRTPLNYLYHRDSKHNVEKLEILKMFLNLGIVAKPGNKIFPTADTLVHGNQEAIQLVLQSCSDFTATEKFSKRTILHYLARNKNFEVIDQLKRYIHKLNVNAVDRKEYNALVYALRSKNIPMIKFLVEHDAILNFDFDMMAKGTCFNRLKFIIAYIAILQQLGTPIMDIIWSKIDLIPRLGKYLNRCLQLLKTEICGTVTVFKLLTVHDRKMALYLNQEELTLKLSHICYKQKLISLFPFYFNTLRERVLKGQQYKIYKDKAARIFCKITKNCINVVVNEIMDYLSYEDLKQFSAVWTEKDLDYFI